MVTILYTDKTEEEVTYFKAVGICMDIKINGFIMDAIIDDMEKREMLRELMELGHH